MAAANAKSATLFEPIFMDNPDYDRIVKIVYASYPNACVLMLDRVQNPALEARYEGGKAALGGPAEGVKEVQVYHGTKDENIASIARSGFMISANTRSAYGRGTYFASNFATSKDYTNVDRDEVSHMFICRLATKNVEAYARNEATAADTFVDNVAKPAIYVARKDDLCIPMYLVRFYRNAQ
jgi:hypothetical protein